MNTSRHDGTPDRLDAEERALAELLAARAGRAPHPNAELDARILAMAREAAAPRPTLRPRRQAHPRWPLGAGLAASLALVAGLAWQLRPHPETAAVSADSAATVASAPEAAAGPAPAPAPPATVQIAPPPAPPPPPQPARTVVAEPAPSAVVAPPASPPAAEAAAAAGIVDEPAPAPAVAPPAPLPPPPPPPAIPAPAEAATAASAPAPATEATGNTKAARMAAPVQEKASAPREPSAFGATVDQEAATTAAARDAAVDGFAREEIDRDPPATVQSLSVQQRWVQRIRALIAAGEDAAARDSLAEFRRRYPGAPLPEDLRRFAEPSGQP